MPVKRDPRTGGWFFRTVVRFADGKRKRIFGTPGIPGPYQDLASSKVGAQAAEHRAISEALNGKPARSEASATKETPRKTIRQHAETFPDTYKPSSKASEKREKRRVLNTHLLPFFGDKAIEELKQEDVDEYAKAELARGMSVKTINNQLAVLSTMIKYRKGERSKLRFKLEGMEAELAPVAPEDVELLLGEAPDARYRVVVLLASEAGYRAGEIRGAQRTDVKDGQATVRRSLNKQTNEVVAPKHNKLRTVPLSPRLEVEIAALPKRSIWLIAEEDGSPVTYDRLSDTIGGMYDRAGVARPPKPLHCLRHTFGTVMAKKVPLGVLQKLMGHADIKTTMRYVDVGEADKRAAIKAVFGSAVAATRQQRERRPKTKGLTR